MAALLVTRRSGTGLQHSFDPLDSACGQLAGARPGRREAASKSRDIWTSGAQRPAAARGGARTRAARPALAPALDLGRARFGSARGLASLLCPADVRRSFAS
jgi:hypothetical protein